MIDRSINFFEDLFEKTYLALTYIITKEPQFKELFPIGVVYDNSDRQLEGFKDSYLADEGRFSPVQLHHLMMCILQKDILDNNSTREQNVSQMQKCQFI